MKINIKKLENFSSKVRKDILEMIYVAGSGNPGSALSCVEILIWLMIVRMNNYKRKNKLILSKGHSAPVFYSILSHLKKIKRNELFKFRMFNTKLQTHPDIIKLKRFVDFPSGSLGQGLSAANGMSLAAKYLNKKLLCYVLIGDGEMQEGQIWEAIMTAGHYKLSNIIVIVDDNKFQQDGSTKKIKKLESLSKTVSSFGWEVLNTNGHSIDSLETVFKKFKSNKPKMIIADTVKGKGIKFMENNNDWHTGGKKFTLKKLQLAKKYLLK
jgi:transketolase